MGFFDEGDDFDEIVRQFFGGRHSMNRRVPIQEKEERQTDFVETDKKVFFIFELPGYEEEDIDVEVKGRELTVNAKKKNTSKIQGYLSQKLGQGIVFKKELPKNVNTKKFDSKIKNGVLEVEFKK